MPTPAIRTIIFDIGRVLVRVDIRRAQVGLAEGLSLTAEELWSAIEKDPRWADWQEGRMSPRDWHLNLSSRLGTPHGFDQFPAVWHSAPAPEQIRPSKLVESRPQHYRL